MKHYVYKLEDTKTGEFYFGSRTCECNIEDDKYMGSPKTWKPNKNNLHKIILKNDFQNRTDAILYEKKLVEEYIKHPLNKNYSIPNTGFYYGGEPQTNPNYGNRHDLQWKNEQSERMKTYYQKNKATNLGKKFSNEWKQNISKSRKEKGLAKGKNNPNSYGNVIVTDLDGNKFVFETAFDAAKYFKKDRYTLTQHCKNKTKYRRGKYKGWVFEFLE